MKITDAFIQEHAEITQQLDQLEVLLLGEIKTLTEVKEPGAKLAAELDKHANLEEDLLFDALEAKMGDDDDLRDVRDDHARIEKLMQDVLGTLEDIQRLGHARRNLLKAIKVARAHFSREEKKTFPLAEEILGKEKLLELGAEWQKRRQQEE
jgi:hemerythrin-like domain-containing protein